MFKVSRLLFVCVLFLLVSCDKTEKAESGTFLINGKIEGLTAEKVFLVHGQQAIDTADVKEGAFTFKGKVTEPDVHTVFMLANNQPQGIAQIFLENATLNITGKIDKDRPDLTVSGSPLADKFQELNGGFKKIQDVFNPQMKALQTEAQALQAQGKPLPPALQQRGDSLQKSYSTQAVAMLKDFIKANPSSLVSAYVAASNFGQGADVKEVEEVAALLTGEAKTSKYAQSLTQVIEESKKLLSQPALPFTQNDVNGKPISLESFKGKYVLVDFWASWCKPCRAENPNVVNAYNAYKAKNFDVLGVSLDDNKEKWLDAIKTDGLTWKQVSDLKGWKNEVALQYGITQIPFNILVNPEGVIVAKNLRGPQLMTKLAEVLK